ncbi:MAG: phosphoenolpyruvate carboxylase [Phycisphaeraceae bacterium]
MPDPAARQTFAGDRPLRRDIRLLTWLLREVIIDHEGRDLWTQILGLREQMTRRQDADDPSRSQERINKLITGLPTDRLIEVVRSLGLFFDLANLAEDRHRIRVLRQRAARGVVKGSIAASIMALRDRGLERDQIDPLIEALDVELVFTAHPTEAKRKTARRIIARLRNNLGRLDEPGLIRPARRRIIERLRLDLVCLWTTDTLRPRRPDVDDELGRALFAVRTVWNVVPEIHRHLERALDAERPVIDAMGHRPVRSVLRFGNWIGGDRDGNPSVTVDVTAATLLRLHRAAIQLHLKACQDLHLRLTLSRHRVGRTTPEAARLETAIARAAARWPRLRSRIGDVHDDELLRQWMTVVRYRLKRTTDSERGAYGSAQELAADLRLVERYLRSLGYDDLADAELRDWQVRVATFGLHLLRLDVRENSDSLRAAINELLKAERDAGVVSVGEGGGIETMSEVERIAYLTQPMTIDRVAAMQAAPLSESTHDLVESFRVLQRTARTRGEAPLGMQIISMTHEPSDALAMLYLSRLGAALDSGASGRLYPQPIVPLLETVDDLDHGPEILDQLLSNPAYRAHVEATGGEQVVMVGYSDSAKDGGYLSSNWSLHHAQQQLAAIADRHGIKLRVFHGRGGALGRGGGPAARAIASLPSSALRGRLRMTEQGEVLAERYDDPAVADRHLEQVLSATLLASAAHDQKIPAEWPGIVQRMSDASRGAYRELIEQEGFVAYFRSATPISAIEQMPIGSRPSRRTAQTTLSDLRAIPYTFAWTQSRQLLNAFFGFGSGYKALSDQEKDDVAEMYVRWPFFTALVDNAELALAKCDPEIARFYASLGESPDRNLSIWRMIRDEVAVSTEAVLGITGRGGLLEGTPWLQRMIRVRNPYVDALNFIQVDLLRRQRAVVAAGGDPTEETAENRDLQLAVRLSIQAIASGLRNTG